LRQFFFRIILRSSVRQLFIRFRQAIPELQQGIVNGLRQPKDMVMVSKCGRHLLFAVIIGCVLSASPLLSQGGRMKKEAFWDPASGSPAIIRQAQQAYDKQKYMRALSLYRQALETLPENYLSGFGAANIHFEIGTCYTKLRRYTEAIAAIQKSDSYYPDPYYMPTHCAWLGMVYSRMENYEKSEFFWQKAIEKDPSQSVYFAGMANNSVRLGHYDKAQKAIDQGRRIAPTGDAQEDFKEAQLIVHLAKGNYAEASRMAAKEKMLGMSLLDTDSGAIQVNFVFQGGPAQLAGIATGDIVQSVNGKPARSVIEILNALKEIPFASTVIFRVNRNQSSLEARVIVGIPPNLPELASAASGR
jgi:tetratricopeptide (TPR) repeat protein